MRCRLCRSADTYPLPFAVPEKDGAWVRCRACGSDSNSLGYDPALYPLTHDPTPIEGLREDCRTNCDWFDHYHELDERTFLDVGCARGAALDVMAGFGWSVHGFDVNREVQGSHVTVAPLFSRWLFPRRFAAVLCREVVEHVESPDLLLHELHGATVPGGLVQVQTPRPIDHFHGIPYQRAHLAIISPAQLRRMLGRAMLDVVDERHWDMGQAYLCRARR